MCFYQHVLSLGFLLCLIESQLSSAIILPRVVDFNFGFALFEGLGRREWGSGFSIEYGTCMARLGVFSTNNGSFGGFSFNKRWDGSGHGAEQATQLSS